MGSESSEWQADTIVPNKRQDQEGQISQDAEAKIPCLIHILDLSLGNEKCKLCSDS